MAKEQKQEQVPVPAPEENEGLGPPKSYRMQITLGIVSLILFEMIILWLLLPPRTQVQADMGLRPGNMPNGIDSAGTVPAGIGKREAMVERALQDNAFVVQDVRGDYNEKLSLVMHVQIRKNDAANYDKRFDLCKFEIISSITTILSASSSEERAEASRTAIREKSKAAINNILGTNWVQQVFVSDVKYDRN